MFMLAVYFDMVTLKLLIHVDISYTQISSHQSYSFVLMLAIHSDIVTLT